MVQEDLLAQFIDGKLPEEEADTVADILSSEDESLQEWRQSIVAASLADCPAPVKMDRRRIRALITNQTCKKNNLSLWWGVSLALVACLAVAVIVFRPTETAVQTEALTADNTQTTETEATQTIEEQPDTYSIAPDVESRPDTPAPPVTQTVSAETSHPEDVFTASSGPAATIYRNVEMIRPSKENYSVRVVNPSRAFVFRWETVGAVKTKIEVWDKNGNLLVSDIGPKITELSVPSSTLLAGSPVKWRLAVIFNDDSVQEKTGKITFVRGY